MPRENAVAIHSTRCACIQQSKLSGESVNTDTGTVILLTPTAISKYVSINKEVSGRRALRENAVVNVDG